MPELNDLNLSEDTRKLNPDILFGLGKVTNNASSTFYSSLVKPPNTHHARKTYSELIKREFDSRAEARHAEELFLRQKAGEITGLQYQVLFVLSDIPHHKVTISIDFKYIENGKIIWEDVKGEKLTKKLRIPKPRIERDFLVKLA